MIPRTPMFYTSMIGSIAAMLRYTVEVEQWVDPLLARYRFLVLESQVSLITYLAHVVRAMGGVSTP